MSFLKNEMLLWSRGREVLEEFPVHLVLDSNSLYVPAHYQWNKPADSRTVSGRKRALPPTPSPGLPHQRLQTALAKRTLKGWERWRGERSEQRHSFQ